LAIAQATSVVIIGNRFESRAAFSLSIFSETETQMKLLQEARIKQSNKQDVIEQQ
jgi:hypothetical protein